MKIRRRIDVTGLDSLPDALTAERIELLIPIVGHDGKTGSVFFKDVPGREVSVDYEGFERHYRNWEPPKIFP